MGRRKKMPDAEFLEVVKPLVARNATYAEIGQATGYSPSGAQNRLSNLLGVRKPRSFRFQSPTPAADPSLPEPIIPPEAAFETC